MRLLADENFNGDIVRGLLLRHSELDIVRVERVEVFIDGRLVPNVEFGQLYLRNQEERAERYAAADVRRVNRVRA